MKSRPSIFRIEPVASYLLGKCSTTKPHPQLWHELFHEVVLRRKGTNWTNEQTCGISPTHETLMVLSLLGSFCWTAGESMHLSSLSLFIYEKKIKFSHTSSDCAWVRCFEGALYPVKWPICIKYYCQPYKAICVNSTNWSNSHQHYPWTWEGEWGIRFNPWWLRCTVFDSSKIYTAWAEHVTWW